ncbi:MAG: serine/threonine protein kinase [Peptostreptococcaceae bacterium]
MDKYYKPGENILSYTIVKLIGEGRYGIVYLAQDSNSNKYIIKQLKKDMLKKTRKKLFYEEKLLSKLNSTKFPKFIGTFVDNDVEGYILEYIEGKVFEDLLYDGYEFTKSEIYAIAEQLLDIIELLHRNNIVHRDIRLPNVILKNNNELVLIDFGLARYIDKKRHTKQIDYWFFSDFLIHLYYTTFNNESPEEEEIPWFEELDLTDVEKHFLMKLMGIDGEYNNLYEIRRDLSIIKNSIE